MDRTYRLTLARPRGVRWTSLAALVALAQLRPGTAEAQAPAAPAPAPAAPSAPPTATPPDAPAPAPAAPSAPPPQEAAPSSPPPPDIAAPPPESGPPVLADTVPAEPVPTAAASTPDDDKLKAVVVTAQRREESVQDVPTTVTVLGGDDLTRAGVGRSAKEVLEYVPNASAVTQSHGRPRWWIRGVGTGQQQLDFSNPVGFYLDDVYISNATATGFPLFDLDRVEILRGPQGTLWGKNTTGGAINVISRRPGFEYDGYLKFDYGSYKTKILEGAFGGPIWKDRLAARGSFHYEDRGPRFRNAYNGRKEGDLQDGAARLQILARITPELEALANVHVRRYSNDGSIWNVTGTGPSRSYLEGYVPSRDYDAVNSNAPGWDEIRQTGALLNLRAEFGKYTITSISGYEHFTNDTASDSDNTPLEVSRRWSNSSSYQFSEEIRVASPRDDRWNWIGGIYFISENIDREDASAKLPGVGVASAGPANYGYTVFDHETRSVAAFGSTTFDFTRALSLTAGLRWTLENRQLEIGRVANAPDAPPTFSNPDTWWEPENVTTPLTGGFNANPQKTWTNFTYDVTPKVRITDDVLVYFRYAHGVKSGGYNTAATSLQALNRVEPEQLDNFELGAKTAFFGNRLTINAALFHYIYRDVQINVVGPLPPTNTPVSYLQNVEDAVVNGAEIEIDSVPVRNLRLGGSLGLLDTEFTDFQVLNNGPDYSGNEFVRSPHVTLLARADYRVPLPILDEPFLGFGGDVRYLSRQMHFTTNQDTRLLQTAPFANVNARISLASADEKLALTGYAQNLLDIRYRQHTLPATRNATGSNVTWSDPLTLGVSLTSRWY
jgi:iron complex outermembrane receptor protein